VNLGETVDYRGAWAVVQEVVSGTGNSLFCRVFWTGAQKRETGSIESGGGSQEWIWVSVRIGDLENIGFHLNLRVSNFHLNVTFCVN